MRRCGDDEAAVEVRDWMRAEDEVRDWMRAGDERASAETRRLLPTEERNQRQVTLKPKPQTPNANP